MVTTKIIQSLSTCAGSAQSATAKLTANDRLIAAAPDMLGGLECSTATLDACLPHVTGERKRMVEMQIKANRAAIAKAKGE